MCELAIMASALQTPSNQVNLICISVFEVMLLDSKGKYSSLTGVYTDLYRNIATYY